MYRETIGGDGCTVKRYVAMRGGGGSAMKARMKSTLKKATMGLLVAALTLGLVEVTLRLVFGAPAPSRLVRQLWNASAPAFTESGGVVQASFQDGDMIPPFSAAPAPGVVRVMVFGESSVRAGSQIPLAQEFPALLQAGLTEKGLNAEVLNLGRPGMDSYGLKILVEQALVYKPDIAVLYTGHNDIGNAYMTSRFGDVKSAVVGRLQTAVDQLQLYALLRKAVSSAKPQQFVPDAMLMHRADPLPPVQRRMAEQDFEHNLSWIVRELKAHGVRVVLSTVGSMLTRWNAGHAACEEALPQNAWTNDGMRAMLNQDAISLEQANAALQTAPDCPEAYFVRGLREAEQGQTDAARQDLIRARDLDRVPLRATSGIIEGIKRVAAEEDVPLADFESAVYGDLNHAWLFADVVHLSAEGHVLVAQTLWPLVAEQVTQVAAQKKVQP